MTRQDQRGDARRGTLNVNDLAGPLLTTSGGSGLTSYTQGDMLVADSTSTLARLAAVSTGNVLLSGGVGSTGDWGKVELGTTGTGHVTGNLPATNGGTGNTGYVIGDLLQASSTSALARLPAVAVGNALLSGGIGAGSAWGKIDLSSTGHVTGTLPVASGGSGQTSYTNGQLLVGNTTGNTLGKATLTAGDGIDITNGASSITIDGEAASLTNPGIVELATVAETNTGTDATRSVTPDGLDGWTGSAQLVTVGALDSGSITSGFGNVDIGTSTLGCGNQTVSGVLTVDSNSNVLAFNIDSEATNAVVFQVNAPTANVLGVLENAHATTPWGLLFDFTAATPNDATQYFVQCDDATATRFQFLSNGGLANFQANDANLSDGNLKTDLSPVKSYWDAFRAIKIGTFCYLDQSDDVPNIGADANQVYEVAPELTTLLGEGWHGPEGVRSIRGIYETDFNYVHRAVTQELQDRVELLETRMGG